MEYILFLGETESREIIMPGDPGFDEYMASWTAYNQKLIDGGHWISGGRLQPTATATTIRRTAGKDTIVDGPFAETKEQLGGYYIISAADLDKALALAAGMPFTDAVIEVRPIAFRPDAP
ncbi:YciI family protein [soil metagenome]